MKYDYIIAGSGCAGLSLAYYILSESSLHDKSILLIDSDLKTENDRTWCFWEKEKGVFDSVVCKKWDKLEFKNQYRTINLDLGAYSYKMIQGSDFYDFVKSILKNSDRVTFSNEKIENFLVDRDHVNVVTDKNNYRGTYAFNSTDFYHPKMDESNTLLQHFMGQVIEVPNATFDSDVGTLMDFSVHQDHGTTFMYVLPLSSTKALVEYTLFTKSVLEKEDYKKALEHYIYQDLGIERYSVSHEEYGIIPMSKASFSTNKGKRIINIGTAGGYTKASSGYTFQFIQKHTQQIVNQLKNGKSPLVKKTFRDKMFDWYDRTLVDVLLKDKISGRNVFSNMFEKVNAKTILSFLDNESTVFQDAQIMSTLVSKAFTVSGISQLFKKN